MAKFTHISPDGVERKCKNPATCKFKPVSAPSKGLSIPESMGKEKKRQVRTLYSSGMTVTFISSLDDIPKREKGTPEPSEKSSHSDIDFFTEELEFDIEEILASGNPLKV